MELKYVVKNKNLNEFADIANGERIKTLNKILEKIGPEVEKAGYGCKIVPGKGLYILPKDKYLCKIVITVNESDVALSYDIRIVGPTGNINNATMFEKVSPDQLLSYANKLNAEIDKCFLSPKELGNEIQGTNVAEALINEAGFKDFFTKAAEKVKDTIGNIKNNMDAKAADRQDSKALKASMDTIADVFTEALQNEIKSIANGSTQVQINKKVDAKQLIITANASFIAAIAVAPTMDASKDGRLMVSKIDTPLGKVNIAGTSFVKAITALGNALGFQVALSKESAIKTGSSEEEANNISSYETNLRTQLGVEISNLIGESLNEELDSNKIKQFDDAIPAASKAMKMSYLVRLFLLKNNGIEEKDVDGSFAEDLGTIVLKKGTFNPNANIYLKAVLNFYAKNNKFDKRLLEFLKALDLDSDPQYYKSKPEPIYMSEKFFESNAGMSTEELAETYSYYVDTLNGRIYSSTFKDEKLKSVYDYINKYFNLKLKGKVNKKTAVWNIFFKDLNTWEMRSYKRVVRPFMNELEKIKMGNLDTDEFDTLTSEDRKKAVSSIIDKAANKEKIKANDLFKYLSKDATLSNTLNDDSLAQIAKILQNAMTKKK